MKMSPHPFLSLTLGLMLTVAGALPALAQEPPRLVVFLSVDQMRADYITRYGPQWTRGLKRLADEGALFVEGAYPYFNTVTCAGHATMGTGTFPATHGMVLNAWFDRATQKSMSCTDDTSVSLIGYGKAPAANEVGHSAKMLRVPTFADELRGQAARPPRIVTMSMKPRSAIGLAGHAGDIVLWYSGATGFTSSTAYGKDKHPFVESYLAKHPVEADFAATWTKLLKEEAYLYEDAGAGEQAPQGWTPTFPHPIRVDGTDKGASSRWVTSPYSDAYLGKLAIGALEELKLGQQPGIDYLGVSFSAVDAVGHPFGPRSHEVQDTLARLDRTIGDLLDALDAKVGAGRYVVALTGDHGVSPIPEQMQALGIDAGRVNLKSVSTAVETALSKHFGPGTYIAHVAYTDLYFKPGVFERLQADPKAMQLVIDTIQAVPGVQRVLRTDRLADVRPEQDRLAWAAHLNYVPERSGDLYILPKPYWLMSSAGTTHGTGYLYDERVPVLLFGAGIKPGKYWGAATPADLAPTLAALCGVTMANPDGRVLAEALAYQPAPPHQTAGRK